VVARCGHTVQAASLGPALVGGDAALLIISRLPGAAAVLGALLIAGCGCWLASCLPTSLEDARLHEERRRWGDSCSCGPTGRPSWRLPRRTRQWETPALVTALQQVSRGGAGDTKAAAGGRGGRHAWPGGHTSAGRHDRRWLVRRSLGWQPRPRPARPTSRADGAAASDGGSATGECRPATCTCQTGSAGSWSQAPARRGPSRQTGGHKATGPQPACAIPARSPVIRIVTGLDDRNMTASRVTGGGRRPSDGGRQGPRRP